MDTKLFTVGPVEMYPGTLELAGRPVPYFRNQAFSEVMLACESLFLKALKCQVGHYRLVTLTASATGAMEASIMNCLTTRDRAIVIDGGTFGARFDSMLQWHGIPHDAVSVPFEDDLTREMLDSVVREDHTALLVNLDETSIGKLYDLDLISSFCREHGLFLIVDGVSAFLSDPIDMDGSGIDVFLTGSQKGLALSPGLSFVVLGERARERAREGHCASMYFDFNDYLENGERGQTPFTPAIGIVYELADMLERVDAEGVDDVVNRTARLAEDFRRRVVQSGLPLSMPGFSLSNALTPIIFRHGGAKAALKRLEDEHGLVLNPCGGAHADTMARVAHIGNHTAEDNAALVAALEHVI